MVNLIFILILRINLLDSAILSKREATAFFATSHKSNFQNVYWNFHWPILNLKPFTEIV